MFVIDETQVLARLEWDSSEITETSIPLSLGDIRTYLDDALSQLTSLLKSHDLSPASLDDTSRKQIENAAIAYAVAESLAKSRMRGSAQHDAAWEQWTSLWRRYTQSASVTSRSSNRILSTSKSKPAANFKGRDYQW